MSIDESSRLRKRYADVESAYTNEDYTEALNQGLALLQDLQDAASKPLRMRLLLLLGHTWLYGLGDRDSAAVAYGQVAEDNEEQVLQEIALDGLSRTIPVLTGKDDIQAESGNRTDTMAHPAEPTVIHPAPSTPQATGSDQAAPSNPWTASEPRPQRLDPGKGTAALGNSAAAPWLPATTTIDAAACPQTPQHQGMPMGTDPGSTTTSADNTETAAWGPTATASQAQGLEPERAVIPSTLSFSPEEEQELAKGLLLVVIN